MKKIAITLLIVSLFSCSGEELTLRPFPRVKTQSVTNITNTGGIFHADMLSSPVPVSDHGFLWLEQSSPIFENADRISLGPKTAPGPFEALCERGLTKGKKYYVRGYLVSENKVVYGNTVEFVSMGSKPPVLADFNPKIASWGDTITLTGESFSTMSAKSIIKFNAATATFVSASTNVIRVKVPYDLPEEFSTISLSTPGNPNTSTLPTNFQLKIPVIESVTPPAALPGETVVIKGKFMASTKISVYFKNSLAPITNLSLNTITCKVPESLSSGFVTLKLETGNGNLYTTTTFEVQ